MHAQSSEGAVQGFDLQALSDASGQSHELEDIAQLDLEALLRVPVVEVASRRSQTLQEAPASISVISARDMERMAVTSPAQALRMVPGIDVIPKDERVHLVGMRGFNSLYNNRVLVLLDGRTLSDASPTETAPWDLLPLHPADLEKIEVLRGPGSTQYGANAFSGVISLRSKRPLDHPGLEARATLAQQHLPEGLLEAQTRWAYQAHGAYGWTNQRRSVGARASLTAGQPAVLFPALEEHQVGGEGKLAARVSLDLHPTETWHTEADASLVRQEAPAVYYTYRWQARRTELAGRLRSEKKDLLVDGLGLRLESDYRDLSSERPPRNEFLPTPDSMMPDNRRGHARAALSLELLEKRAQLEIAADLTLEHTRYPGFDEAVRFYRAGVLDGQVALDRSRTWLLNAGLRAERIDVDAETAGKLGYENVNWNAGLVWQPHQDHALRATMATAFRTPNASQSLVGTPYLGEATYWIPRPDLAPEQVYTGELGYRGMLTEQLRGELTLFTQRMEDTIDVARRAGAPFYFEPWQDRTSAGLEGHVAAQPFPWADLQLSYTLTRTLWQRIEESGEAFPRHIASAWCWLRPLSNAELNLGLFFSSGFDRELLLIDPLTDGRLQREHIAASLRLDMSAAYRPWEAALAVFVSAQNLVPDVLSKEQIRPYPERAGATAEGRTVLVGISTRTGGTHD